MIIVFGSINVDFVTRVEHIPQPGETILGPSYAVIPGGKGANQALAARRAGSQVMLVGAVGQDPFADIALSLLHEDGVDLAHVAARRAAHGGGFISVDDHGENAIVVASGANAAGARRADRWAGLLGARHAAAAARGAGSRGRQAAARMRAGAGRVVLNAAPAGPIRRRLLASLDVLVVNEHEVLVVGEALGLSGDPDAVARAIDEQSRRRDHRDAWSQGAIGWTGGVRRSTPSLPITPVDTTAAGDTFCGAFAAALDQGFGFTTALARAAAAGSLACTISGAQPSIPWKSAIDEAAEGFVA